MQNVGGHTQPSSLNQHAVSAAANQANTDKTGSNTQHSSIKEQAAQSHVGDGANKSESKAANTQLNQRTNITNANASNTEASEKAATNADGASTEPRDENWLMSKIRIGTPILTAYDVFKGGIESKTDTAASKTGDGASKATDAKQTTATKAAPSEANTAAPQSKAAAGEASAAQTKGQTSASSSTTAKGGEIEHQKEAPSSAKTDDTQAQPAAEASSPKNMSDLLTEVREHSIKNSEQQNTLLSKLSESLESQVQLRGSNESLQEIFPQFQAMFNENKERNDNTFAALEQLAVKTEELTGKVKQEQAARHEAEKQYQEARSDIKELRHELDKVKLDQDYRSEALMDGIGNITKATEQLKTNIEVMRFNES